MVCADDMRAALKAVSINSVLWGGIYNPIVPTSPDECRVGLLTTFDPDYLVDLTNSALPDPLPNDFKDRIAAEGELVCEREDRPGARRLNLGFGIGPVLWHIHENELRGGTKPSPAALATDVPPAWVPYASFVFGDLSGLHDMGVDVRAAYKELALATEVAFDPDKEGVDYGKWVFPINATTYGIRAYGGFGNSSSHIAYLGDPCNLGDLIEFWNIRAAGRDVWFLPVTHYQKQRPMLERIVKAGHYHIMNVDNHADLQKAPSVPDDQFKSVCEWVKTLGIGPLAFRDWSPRFGVSIPRYLGDIHAARLEAARAEETTLFEGETLTPVKMIPPPYLERDAPPMRHRWAVEVSISNPHTTDDWICRLPRARGMEKLLHRHMASDGTLRLTDNGLVALEDCVHERACFFPVRTFDVVSTVLEEVTGLRARQSLPGRCAERIIRKMGTLEFDCRVLKMRGVREVITKLNDPDCKLTKGNIRDIVMSTATDHYGRNWREDLYRLLWIARDSLAENFTGVFDFLLDRRVIRPGLTLRCESCFREDWYHVSEFDEEYTCRYCFNRQRVDFARAKEWQYKADGLFRVPNSADGSVGVILALWRLNALANRWQRGYVSGVELCRSDGSVESELDYCFVVMGPPGGAYELVLGEAKSFVDYEEEKMRKVTELADRFEVRPYLAFATLKDEFSDAEKSLLRDLVRREYRVIPLTRLELDPYDLYRRFENAPHKYPTNFSEFSESLVHVNLEA